ncbi:hypothetical protein AB0D65_08540 [Streptomyces griseoloalbus]|uniref:Uncharacterized protein n=1 Tax=Streptomyces griseoloalbus TaxID=67303 RepID=A0ABV3E1N2_9ACTN
MIRTSRGTGAAQHPPASVAARDAVREIAGLRGRDGRRRQGSG